MTPTPTPQEQEQIDALKEMFREGWDDPENLLPVLKPYVEKRFDGAVMLRHPLVYQVWIFNAWTANKLYKVNSERLDEALAEGNYATAVWVHERPYRVEFLGQLYDTGLIDAKFLRQHLPGIYADTENAWQTPKTLELFKIAFAQGGTLFDDEAPVKLPSSFTIYRGAQAGIAEISYSWSRSLKIATWFSIRYGRENAVLHRARISVADVLAYLNNRGEKEIVADPATLRKIMKFDTSRQLWLPAQKEIGT
jgi:hypothetical protein